jgi:hypothetical protein
MFIERHLGDVAEALTSKKCWAILRGARIHESIPVIDVSYSPNLQQMLASSVARIERSEIRDSPTTRQRRSRVSLALKPGYDRRRRVQRMVRTVLRGCPAAQDGIIKGVIATVIAKGESLTDGHARKAL